MSDEGFFDFLARRGGLGQLAQETYQRKDIEALQDQAEAARLGHSEDLGALSRQVATLTRELAAMKIAFEVLSRVLVETAGVDPTALDARLHAALAPLATAPVVCGNCGMSFAPAQTVKTEHGIVCRRCSKIAG